MNWQPDELKLGDRVTYRDDLGTLHTATVRREPWQLGHGTWIVGLTGRSGGYALDRVVEKLPAISAESEPCK